MGQISKHLRLSYNFSPRGTGLSQHSLSPGGLFMYCKVCKSESCCVWKKKSECLDHYKLGYKKYNQQHGKVAKLKYNYNLSLQELNDMNKNQNNLCFICKKPNGNEMNLVVDHNHETGNVRQLLCRKCNIGLGMFNDNIGILHNAIQYLKQ